MSVPYYIDLEDMDTFALFLRNRIDRHAEDRGDDWKDFDDRWLAWRAGHELSELVSAIEGYGSDSGDICGEALDLAAFAFFIWWKEGKRCERENIEKEADE